MGEVWIATVVWESTVWQGSCGYGLLDKNDWPYWTVGALSTSSSFFEAGPLQGCGECFELQCVENGPVRL